MSKMNFEANYVQKLLTITTNVIIILNVIAIARSGAKCVVG